MAQQQERWRAALDSTSSSGCHVQAIHGCSLVVVEAKAADSASKPHLILLFLTARLNQIERQDFAVLPRRLEWQHVVMDWYMRVSGRR